MDDVLMQMFKLRCTILFLAVMLVASKTSAVKSCTTERCAAAWSAKAMMFMSMISARWNNAEQIEQDKAFGRPVHPNVVTSVFPTEVPQLDSEYTIMTVQTEPILVGQVMKITEDIDGNIRLRPVFVTNREKLRFDIHNPPSAIDFAPDELVELPEQCDIIYTQIEDNAFFSRWPNCLGSPLEALTYFDVVMTCNKDITSWDTGMLENPNPLPFVFLPEERYSLPSKMLNNTPSVPCNCS